MYSELLISDPNLDKLSPLLQLSVWHNQKFLNTGVLAQAVALAWSAVGPAKMLSILSGKRRKVWLPFSKLLEHLGVGSNRSNNFRKMQQQLMLYDICWCSVVAICINTQPCGQHIQFLHRRKLSQSLLGPVIK